MEGRHSIGFTRRTPAYNFRQLSVGVGKEMGREGGEGGTSRCRMHVECKAPARSRFRGNRESRWCPSPPSPSSVTFAQVVESGGTRRWARAERRGEERRRRAGRQSATVPNERRGEENGEAEGEGPGRGHPPPPPSHSPAHPDYPQPGAGHTVMSIEEVLNFHLGRRVFPFRFSKEKIVARNISLPSSIRKLE